MNYMLLHIWRTHAWWRLAASSQHWARIFKRLMNPRNRFQWIESTSLCSLPSGLLRRGCQLFMLMTLFDSRKDLTCLLCPFVSQSVRVGRHRRPWFHPFFSLLEFFTRCLVKILLDVVKNFHYVKKWGIWPSNRKEYQGQQLWAAWAATVPPSKASWLNKGSPLRYHPFGKITAVATW